MQDDRFPKHGFYDQLYARYLKHDPTDLLRMAGDITGFKVLDLACGNGRATLAALNLGAAHVTAVDIVHDVIDDIAMERPTEISVRACDVVHALQHLTTTFDLIISHQAINYWLLECPAELIANRLRPGSRFIFNTFNTSPPNDPTSKDYEIHGRNFHETVYRVGNRIYHTQTATGLEPHTNWFDWISRRTYQERLGNHFVLDERIEGTRSVWLCTRT